MTPSERLAKIHPWEASYDPGLRWDAKLEAHPVHHLMDQTVARYPHARAFDFLGKTYTWMDIRDLADRFAAGLQAQGLRKAARVGLFLPNCPFFLIAYYGVLKAGGTVVNFNPLYAETEIAHQIRDSEIEIMVTADLKSLCGRILPYLNHGHLKKIICCRFTDALPFPKNLLFPCVQWRERMRVEPGPNIVWFHDLMAEKATPAPVVIDPQNDIAVLQYTGGTTGTPKGAMLTHANIYANTWQSVNWFPDLRHGEQSMLGVLPFFHVFAMTAVMNLSVAAGLNIIALPRFHLKDTLKTIQRKKPNFFPAVPAIFSAINQCKDLGRYDLSSLDFCISGGAPLPAEVKKTFEARSNCVVVEGYGLSETSPVVCINPVKGDNRPGAIGLPVQQTIVEIIDPADKTTEMPAGQRGELCVRGPQVMAGYWNKPLETAEVLRGGRLHTGDIAYIDADGYVYIVDRLKDMIITNGYNVYPRNVEEAIYQHEAVEECVVAGVPDAQRGEIVKAWIKLKEGRALNEKTLKSFLSARLSKMEIPRLIEFRTAALPKTMIGKLSRKALLEEALEGKE